MESVKHRGPYAAIVSDFRMPGMNGVQFLSRAGDRSRQRADVAYGLCRRPDGIEAVNEGNIFRLLTKPCPPETLTKALTEGIRQYQLVRRTGAPGKDPERQYQGPERSAVAGQPGGLRAGLPDLPLCPPDRVQNGFTRGLAVRNCGHALPNRVDHPAGRNPEKNLPGCEPHGRRGTFSKCTPRASSLIAKIPRMEEIAEIIAYQEKHFDGSGIPNDPPGGTDSPGGQDSQSRSGF